MLYAPYELSWWSFNSPYSWTRAMALRWLISRLTTCLFGMAVSSFVSFSAFSRAFYSCWILCNGVIVLFEASVTCVSMGDIKRRLLEIVFGMRSTFNIMVWKWTLNALYIPDAGRNNLLYWRTAISSAAYEEFVACNKRSTSPCFLLRNRLLS